MFQSLAFWGIVPLVAGANLRLTPQLRAIALAVLSLALILYLNPVGGAWLAAEVVAVYLMLAAAARLEGAARTRLLWVGVALVVGNLVRELIPRKVIDPQIGAVRDKTVGNDPPVAGCQIAAQRSGAVARRVQRGVKHGVKL